MFLRRIRIHKLLWVLCILQLPDYPCICLLIALATANSRSDENLNGCRIHRSNAPLTTGLKPQACQPLAARVHLCGPVSASDVYPERAGAESPWPNAPRQISPAAGGSASCLCALALQGSRVCVPLSDVWRQRNRPSSAFPFPSQAALTIRCEVSFNSRNAFASACRDSRNCAVSDHASLPSCARSGLSIPRATVRVPVSLLCIHVRNWYGIAISN